MHNFTIYLVFGFLFLLFGTAVWMLINPQFFISQTIFWNTWFLKGIGYEIEIKPTPKAKDIVRIFAGFFLLLSLSIFSMGFDIFMMLFR